MGSERLLRENGTWACITPSAPATSRRAKTLEQAEGSMGERRGSKCGVGREGLKGGEDGYKEELDCEDEREKVQNQK